MTIAAFSSHVAVSSVNLDIGGARADAANVQFTFLKDKRVLRCKHGVRCAGRADVRATCASLKRRSKARSAIFAAQSAFAQPAAMHRANCSHCAARLIPGPEARLC